MNRKCTAQIAYEAFNKGEIDRVTMESLVAMNTAVTLGDHPVRAYADVDPALALYRKQRDGGMRARDQSLAINNGAWVQSILRTFSMNNADVEYLRWAREICVDRRAMDKATKIDGRLREYRDNPFPRTEFEAALRVQKMDSRDDRRSGHDD